MIQSEHNLSEGNITVTVIGPPQIVKEELRALKEHIISRPLLLDMWLNVLEEDIRELKSPSYNNEKSIKEEA